MKIKIIIAIAFIAFSYSAYNCNAPADNKMAVSKDSTPVAFSGFESAVKWGRHIATIAGCQDCHTPKKMSAHGPVSDTAMAFGGALTHMQVPAITPQQLSMGTAATTDQTAWIGPWGKSFAANISSDSTGIGNWKEQQFIDCLRKGMLKGLAGTRPLMPPMPWEDYSHMSDNELKALFAYLKSTRPVRNIVPQYEPPVVVK